MDRIPWWAIGSALAAPVLLIGGWSVAAALQPSGYNPVRETISALAARGATDRWVMTAALLGVGVSYLVTAAGLSVAGRGGRIILAGGGVATVAVALFPQPVHGTDAAHTAAATAAFVGLALWPAAAAQRYSLAPLLRPSVSVAATVGSLALVAWFAIEIHGSQRGLAERAVAGSQSLWPLAVVFTTRRGAGSR